MLLQMRARSKSLGMIGHTTTHSMEPNSVASVSSTASRLPSVSSPPSLELQRSQLQQDLLPPYDDDTISELPSLRSQPSIESLDDREGENDYLPPPRHPIRPRPEEGNEILPYYSCTVFRSAIVNRKIECIYPGLPAKKREWGKVYCVILGTVLRLYLIQPDGTLPANFSLANPHREYTLQYAEAGIAADYVKKKFVLRIRAEGEQFLMQCSNEEDRDAWVEAVQAGSSIALALEDRSMPKHVTLPRRRRGRYAPTPGSRTRPVLQRLQPLGGCNPVLQTVQSAPTPQTTDLVVSPQRSASCVTVDSEYSTVGSCTGDAPSDPDFDAATALALCIGAGRSRAHPRERILTSVLTARQARQAEWVIINGSRRKIDPKSGDLEDSIPEGTGSEEDELRARLLKSKKSFPSRIFKLF